MARTKATATAAAAGSADRVQHFTQYQPSQSPRRFPPTRRVNFYGNEVELWGWPSRGGVIVLPRVAGLDFSFLGLDPVDPPMLRDRDQDAEDNFCQRLLLLGGKWFDSDERRGYVAGMSEVEYGDDDFGEEGQPAPTSMERGWVAVAYADADAGESKSNDSPASLEVGRKGLWVAEYDALMRNGVLEEENQVPSNAAQVQLARNMTEKVDIVKRLPGAKFYASLEEYARGGGRACLNSWATRTTGEVGALVKTTYPE